MPESAVHAPLLIDIAGPELQPHERVRLQHPLVGGVILFTRHWRSREQLQQLCAQIKSLRPDLLIAVDHEGGRVQRFRDGGFTPLPAMAELGRLWLDDAMAAVQAAAATGFVLGAELRACGIDLSFTPVLDLDHGRSAVIGSRAFGADPRVVALLAAALIGGLQRAGLAHCAKHFPGHGWASADSHVAAPRDSRSLRAILDLDAAPYGWLRHQLQAVMPAHVVYSRVDAQPAGFSRRWLGEILRERLGFSGAVISDDLSMQGARSRAGDDADAVLQALAAGCDLALLCNQSLVDAGAGLDRVLERLARAAACGDWQPDPRAEQRRLELLPARVGLGWDELMLEPAYRAALDDVAALAARAAHPGTDPTAAHVHGSNAVSV